jgi:hypothetical protein
LTTEIQWDFWAVLNHKSVAINLTSVSKTVGFSNSAQLLKCRLVVGGEDFTNAGI